MLTLVPTPLGNLDDITIRSLKAFESCDVCFCEDTRVTGKLFSLLKERELLRRDNKVPFISLHEHNQEKILHESISLLQEKNCIYVSDAGMPGISDPGSLLVRFCREHAIEYSVLPGASAAITAFSACGEESGKFLFYGFLPHKSVERQKEIESLLSLPFPVIFYEAPHRLIQLSDELAKFAPTRFVFALKELSKIYETYWYGDVKEFVSYLKKNAPKGEWTVILYPGKSETRISFSFNELLALELPPKVKAKLLAQIGDKSAKEYYTMLLATTA